MPVNAQSCLCKAEVPLPALLDCNVLLSPNMFFIDLQGVENAKKEHCEQTLPLLGEQSSSG